ncbi:hypothetical protein [Treponema berlinense]|uniref:hypothetical protein n=1 Tax=Treponema berlinense TaxID=225004 RepID=UPI0026EE6EBA|nr:hypothetical protein [Treponema berlinense]
MKNRKNIFAALAACAAMVFASCSNLTDANVSSTTENKNLLNVEITNYDDILTDVSLQANTGSRTIIPESFVSTGVDFYIFGDNIGGGKLSPTKVDFTGKKISESETSTKVGTVNIPAESNIWDFTLIAVPKKDPATEINESTALAEAVLIGYDTVDMINGDVAKFTLAPDGLTKAGEIAMKLYTDGWTIPTGFTAKAGIYLLTTGADATDTGDGAGTATEAEAAFTDATVDEANAIAYAVASMKPGTYLFKVTFTNDTGKKNFYYSDVIVVLPGKTIDEVVGIPNVIGTIPAAPTAFKAGYVASTEDKYNGIYITEFEWVRPTSKNETYLEIDLLELDSSSALPGDDTEWGNAITAGSVSTTYGMDFAASDIYESGSILSGNTTVQVKLELGKRYAARIRAVNDAGASANAYVTVGATTKGTAFTSAVINRYRIKYYLNGGTLYQNQTDATNKENGTTTNVVVYKCEDTTDGVAILDGTAAPNIIKKGDYTWSYWSKDATTDAGSKYTMTGDPAAPEVYKGYANLDLYAIFTTNAEVAIFDKASLKILPGWITVDSTPLTGNTVSIDYADVTGDKITWVIAPADIKAPDGSDINDFAYDSVTFTVSKSGTTYYGATANTPVGYGTAGSDFTFNLPVSSLAAGAGVYQVMFTASYKSTTVSLPITFTYTK